MATINENTIRAMMQRFGIVGQSPALIAAIRRAMLVAPIDLSVLIIGESGSGKESFPKIIHEGSPRKHKKYIAVNCGAIPAGTISSELFGHEKGSFTNAEKEHAGYFEVANNGTIFLDEVADLTLDAQARLEPPTAIVPFPSMEIDSSVFSIHIMSSTHACPPLPEYEPVLAYAHLT